MAQFTLTIDCGNAAFDDDRSIEICDCLQRVKRDVENGAIDGRIYDTNGNAVGSFSLTHDKESV